MGNTSDKTDVSTFQTSSNSPNEQHKRFVKFQNVKVGSSKVSVSDSALQSRVGCSSFTSQISDITASRGQFHSKFTRTWTRATKKKWDDETRINHLSFSKTAWPVPYFESLFLPEFKIRDQISEDSFSVLEDISSGAFSKVYKVVKKDESKVYAMKVLSKAQLVANNLVNQVKEEVKIQKVIGHNPFIVNCPYHWQSRKQLFIISEYISGGELFKLLEDKGGLPLEIVKLYIAELALALDFLHNAGIVYRDLKLENILLNERGHIQLIDFGLSKWLKYGLRTNTICGTLQYMAPEILQQKSYGHAVDWWSLGIVLVYLYSGQCAYECCLDEKGSVRSAPDFPCKPEIKDLTDRLLVEDPVQRLQSLRALKRTALFMGFDFDQVLNYAVDLNTLTVLKT